jgi:hypothetical protein
VRFQILKEGIIKLAVYWVVTPFSPADIRDVLEVLAASVSEL